MNKYYVALDEGDVLNESMIKLLKLRDIEGYTIAHNLVWNDSLPKQFITDDILKLRDYKRLSTVAHDLAWRGKLPKEFMTFQVLNLQNGNGFTVRHYLKIFIFKKNIKNKIIIPVVKFMTKIWQIFILDFKKLKKEL